MSASPLALPPVRLLPADVLARQALAAPLLERALRLTRWAGAQRRVDGMGELLDDELPLAAAELGLTGDEGLADAAQAWGVAVDTGLLVLDIEEEAEETTPPGEAAGLAMPGEAFARIEEAGAGADPQGALDLWSAATEVALAETIAPDYDNLPDSVHGDGETVEVDGIDWDPDEEAELLDTALVNLYALTALDDGTRHGGADGAVPLPVLAASLVVPEEMEQPSDAVLEEVTAVMMRLDDHFRLLAPTGLLEYEPMDESLIEEEGSEVPEDPEDPDGLGYVPVSDGPVSESSGPESSGPDGSAPDGPDSGRGAAGTHENPSAPEDFADIDAEEISRYGLVRLTPLGVYGVRERLVEAGAHAPVLGDLTDAPAFELLGALAGYPDHAARAEAELWLAGRKPVDAARELLDASQGDDAEAPGRRLMCQQTLTLVGAEAEPALREVLDDRRLGGLARVWLTEQGVANVPVPGPDMVFWLTIDTLAAQIAADEDPDELADLVRDLVSRHEGFFAAAWRVDHPATAAVLETMGRLHPDRKVAKEARKAAFKARSREGSAG